MRADFWDVKFYPYIEVGVDPIFAAVGNVQVSRPPLSMLILNPISDIGLQNPT